MVLAKNEIEKLEELQEEGFTYLARDENGKLHAYMDEDIEDIEKIGEQWLGDDDCEPVDENLFEFITWEDEEPTSIVELLEGVE